MENEKVYVACSTEYSGCGSTHSVIGVHRTKDGADRDLENQLKEDNAYRDTELEACGLETVELNELNAVSGFVAGNEDDYDHTYYYVVEKTMED